LLARDAVYLIRLHLFGENAMSAQLDERMAQAAWDVLLKMRDSDPVGYREMFANLIPRDALPREAYSDRQLEVIFGAVCRGLARRAARGAAALNEAPISRDTWTGAQRSRSAPLASSPW
jgi:hypothetical protein